MNTDCIQAYVRLRPEKGEKSVTLENESTVCLLKTKEKFQFGTDRHYLEFAFDEEATNKQVYERTAAKLIAEACSGHNSCIFSYGQTSSGKTFTMKGTGKDPGIIPLLLSDLFRLAQSKDWNWHMFVRMSYMEIYNENINDLFDRKGVNLDIRENEPVGLTEHKVNSFEEAMSRFEFGETTRKYAETGVNVNSSRSHAVFRVTIESIRKDNNRIRNKASINLIDLAGSEGIDKTKAEGITKKEGESINKSLLTLAMVIKALGQKGQSHIPFRNSKLTRILEPSLSGGSQIMVICNVNPSPDSHAQTVNTLRFGVSAGRVKLSIRNNDFSPGQVSNTNESNEEAENLRKELVRASSQLDDLNLELAAKQGEVKDYKERLEAREGKIFDLESQLRRLREMSNLKDLEMEKTKKSIEDLRHAQKLGSDSSSLVNLSKELDALKSQNQQLREDLRLARNREQNAGRDADMFRSKMRKLEDELSKAKEAGTVRHRHVLEVDHLKIDIDPIKLQNAMLLHVQILEKNIEIRQLNSEIYDLTEYIGKLEKIKIEYELLKESTQQAGKENQENKSNTSKRGREPDERIQRSAVRKIGACKHQLSIKRVRQEKLLATLRRANDKIIELERQLQEEKLKTAEGSLA